MNVDENIDTVQVEITITFTPVDMTGRNVGAEPVTIHRVHIVKGLARVVRLLDAIGDDSNVRGERWTNSKPA